MLINLLRFPAALQLVRKNDGEGDKMTITLHYLLSSFLHNSIGVSGRRWGIKLVALYEEICTVILQFKPLAYMLVCNIRMR